VQVEGENNEESPYVRMTSELIKVFPKKGGKFQIEPDASSGSYFIAAERLLPADEHLELSPQFGVDVPTTILSRVNVANWPRSGWQIDQNFEFARLGSRLPFTLEMKRAWPEAAEFERLQGPPKISRSRHLGDSIMTAIVVAPFSDEVISFTDLGRLRHQECERVVALRTELTRCGAKVVEEGDTLTVYPSNLHGAEIETYNDHRMAMCFAILGLKIPGIKIKNPFCVKKTFPNFFQKLAAAPPKGLGARILDANNGRELNQSELFAE